MRIFLKLFTINPLNSSRKTAYKLLFIKSYILYIVNCINSTSLFFNALSALIPYPYLLAIAAYSSFVSAIVVSIRVGIRVVISLKKLGSKFKVRV